MQMTFEQQSRKGSIITTGVLAERTVAGNGEMTLLSNGFWHLEAAMRKNRCKAAWNGPTMSLSRKWKMNLTRALCVTLRLVDVTRTRMMT